MNAPEHGVTNTKLLDAKSVGSLLDACADPVRYVIHPYFPRGLVTLLSGHGGVGKSNLALTVLAHVAAGLSLFGHEVSPARCAFVSLEDGADLVRHRLFKIAQAYRIDPGVLSDVLIVDGSAADPALAEEHSDMGIRRVVPTAVMAELRDHVRGRAFIVVDNASDAFDGDENSRRQVRGFVRMLAQLARENDAALVLLAHIDKSAARNGGAGNTYSGSTAWHNSARSRIALVEHNGVIELRHEKLNVGLGAKPVSLAWSDEGVLMPTTVAVPARVAASPADDASAVLNAIIAAVAAGQNVPTSKDGRLTTLHVLSKMPELPRELSGGRGSMRFWLAVEALRRAGSIQEQEYRNDNRKVRTRWIPVAAPNAPNAPIEVLAQPELGRIGRAPNAPNAHGGYGGSACAVTHRPEILCLRCDGEGCGHCRSSMGHPVNADGML